MSGCPGGPHGGKLPIFAPWALNPDCEDLWAWQWRERIEPFWADFAQTNLAETPTVQVCIELHAGAAIYNPSSFRRLSRATSGRLRLNFDPSHFWWMGIDPFEVLVSLGDQVRWVHAKDTLVRAKQVREDGVFDFRYGESHADAPWRFTFVGGGHGDEYWESLLAALRAAGYEGPVSIEYEEAPPTTPSSLELGIERSIAALRRVLPTPDHARA
jgi:sugar phosphate isomerase/epimerase